MKITIIYASISGHTEHVVSVLSAFLQGREATIKIRKVRAEQATAEDLTECDLAILACGTWNTTGQEGQLSPHMYTFLNRTVTDLDLGGQKLAFISLGDDRYFYSCRCTEHFMVYQRDHNAVQLLPPLVIVNEPYDQEDKVCRWGEKILGKLKEVAVSS